MEQTKAEEAKVEQPGVVPPPGAAPGAVPAPVPGAQQAQWMPLPAGIPGCPPGLEYLTLLDQLLVHQKVELFEAFTGIETKNKFVIKNSVGQQCLYAYEESDFCMRICCGPDRGFMMHILDNTGKEVMRVVRPFKCCGGCCWCADQECCSFNIQVESPPGNLIGSIHQAKSCWVPYYDIKDATGQQIFQIKGPCCVCPGPCCTCDFPFEIFSTGATGGVPVGKITKQWSGLTKELFTDATNFSVTFPMDLEVKMKAVLLGATFLIDIMFFEHNDQ